MIDKDVILSKLTKIESSDESDYRYIARKWSDMFAMEYWTFIDMKESFNAVIAEEFKDPAWWVHNQIFDCDDGWVLYATL